MSDLARARQVEAALQAVPPAPSRLAANDYLDIRDARFVWFEHLELVRAESAEVVLAPGVLEVLLALVGGPPP